MTRILLGQLGANGDCLYATTIARQIKHDFPGCHLTWAISSLCRRVIDNNPDVDDVWEVPASAWSDIGHAWRMFEREGWNRVARGDFDHAFMTQISPSHLDTYDGTIRPSIFRNYPRPITVPVETVILLTDDEIARTQRWLAQSGLGSSGPRVLFECSSKSGQSFLTPALAVEVAERVIAANPGVGFILSTNEPIEPPSRRIVHGGELSLRETAYLTHFADLFVGCGSGVTVVATSGVAKPALANIQVLKASTSVYASFRHDFEYFGKDASHFLETTREDPGRLADIIDTALRDGIEAAKAAHDERIALDFTWYFRQIEQALLERRDYLGAARSLMVTADRYGWRADLLDFGRTMILPFVERDEKARYPNRQAEIRRLREALIETRSPGQTIMP